MSERKQTKEVLTFLTLCFLWYVASSSTNVVGKMLLSDFPYPMTATMVQLLSITIYSGPMLKGLGVRKFFDVGWSYYFKFLIPLALGKFIASVLTHVSIWKVPVSYVHTVKSTMPLFTVILSRVILGEKQTLKVYCCLLPIIIGVGIATMTELSFNVLGLMTSLAATMQLSLQNIFSKKVLRETGVHHLRLLFILGRLSVLLFFPFWLWFDMMPLVTRQLHTSMVPPQRVILLLISDGFLNWLQNVLAFSVISLVSPLTYAIASASKRIFIIVASLVILGNPVTPMNLIGMATAVLGVIAYNKARHDEAKADVLPLKHAPTNEIHQNGISKTSHQPYRLLTTSPRFV